MPENIQAAEISNFFRREANILKEIERLFESGSHKVVAGLRKITNKELKSGIGFKAVLKVTSGHGQFVQIGEKAGVISRKQWGHCKGSGTTVL